MAQKHALLRLLKEAPPGETVVLFLLLLLARLTEGMGILMLVPILDSLRGEGTPSALSSWFGATLARSGLQGSIGVLLLIFVALVAVRSLLIFAQQTRTVRYQHEVIDGLRRRAFGQLLAAEWRWTSQERASDHVSVLTAGIGRIGAGLNQLIALVASLASMLAYGGAALILSWKVTLIAALCGGAAHLLLARHRRHALLLGDDLGTAHRAVQASLQEGLAGIRLTKILRNETPHLASFSRVVEQLRNQQLKFTRSANFAQLLVQTGGAALLAGLLYAGIGWWAVPLSTLLTIVLVFGRLIPMFASIQQSWHLWLHAVPALAELDALLAASARAAEPVAMDTQPPLELHDAIELDAVTVTYAGRSRAALDAVSVRIAARTTTAIIGPSGAGKSSLADVLMALLEPDKGSMKVDGIAVAGPDRHRWRRSVSYVQQDAFLFNDSVRANLLWSHPNVSDLEMSNALTAAAADFVHALPDGLDTVVGDGGVRLSGGERQRIALARALIGKPSLLILDEATSALDPENEALVRRAIAQLHGNMTIILIGHRLGMLDQVDHVIELRGGQLVSALALPGKAAELAA